MNDGGRTGLFGGSFNPPHIGHQAFVRAISSDSHFKEIWVLPCANHAFGKELAPFEHRIEMSRLAFNHLGENISVKDDELRVGGGGYTIDLIEYLMASYPARHFSLVLGSDNYAVREKWKEFERIESLVEVVFYGRKGYPGANSELSLGTPFPEISSSKIRAMIARGESVDSLVPESVAGYIAAHNLYSD